MPDSPLGNIKGMPKGTGVPGPPNAPEMPQPFIPTSLAANEPLADLSSALEEAQTVEGLVDFAQEIIASMVNAKPEQAQAVAQRTQLLNQVYRLIEVKLGLQ